MGAFQEREVSTAILPPLMRPTRLLSNGLSTQNAESFTPAADSVIAEWTFFADAHQTNIAAPKVLKSK
jgi:hypothetical protein